MRRIFKTTTALVASLSIAMPHIAVAQENPDKEEIILQQKKQQRAQKEGQEQQNAPREQKKQADKQQQKPAEKRPRDEPRKAADEAPKPKKQPAREEQAEPKKQPAREQQAEPKKPKPQRDAQPERSPEAERERPRQEAKPKAEAREDAAPRRAAQDTRPEDTPRAREKSAEDRDGGDNAPRNAGDRDSDQPRKAAATAAAVSARDENDQPRRSPEAERARENRADEGEGNRRNPENAEELRRAMEQKESPKRREPKQRDAAERERESEPRRADETPKPPENQERRAGDPPRRDQDERRRAEDEPRRAQDNAGQDRLTSNQLRERLEEGDGAARIAPPEARHRDNEVTRRAAQISAAPAAAALAESGRGEVSERRITRDQARRSDEDFRTRIQSDSRDGRRLSDEELRREVDRRERQRDRNEARNDEDDDNDTLKTVGALLLAGAAGMAVGKLLDGRQVALNTGDRVVMTMPDGSQQIYRDDNALLYQPGSNVETERFQDGSTRTTVWREDGSRVVTIRDANANILRRTLVRPDGTQVPLINDTAVQPVQVSTLPRPQPVQYYDRPLQEDELRAALLRESATDRRFSLGQIRDIPEVRSLVAPVNVPQITFDTGSAALASSQAEQLSTLGKVIRDAIDANPNEMFMIEGYTDAVGSKASNLALSDRRAESLALALTEYFQVPPENMVVQGYGEEFLLVPSDGPQRDNRRVGVRRITDLLEQGDV
ncbi:OmpA family protein [Paracoccus ravus]|uniref:OmpA family protein n=1 Tax=Paracoccus ravus TaxID=2447760 RepID=UPI00106DD968|nr:OmpA family protein [Paracoccus ravus]